MSKFVKVGVIGTGKIYNDAHRDAYTSKFSDNLVLIGLCDQRDDLVQDQLKWVQKKYEKLAKKKKKKEPELAEMYEYALQHLKAYTSYEKMLDDLEGELDLIDNCTHGRGHIEYSIQAMEHGYHACAEKPPGVNWYDVKRVIDVETKTGKMFQLNENVCYERPVRKTREVIQQDTLGKINTVEVHFGHGGPYVPYTFGETGLPHFIDPLLSGGGCLQDLAPHGISKAFWPIYQAGAKVISCETSVLERRKDPRVMSGKPFTSPVDDWVEAVLELYDPRTDSTYKMNVTTSWCGSFPNPMSIEGDKGSLTIGAIPKSRDYGAIIEPADKSEKAQYFPAEDDKWEPHRGHTREIQMFSQNILEGKPSDTPGLYALTLQEILSIQYFSKLTGAKATREEMYKWGDEIAATCENEQAAIDKISVELTKSVDLKSL